MKKTFKEQLKDVAKINEKDRSGEEVANAQIANFDKLLRTATLTNAQIVATEQAKAIIIKGLDEDRIKREEEAEKDRIKKIDEERKRVKANVDFLITENNRQKIDFERQKRELLTVKLELCELKKV